MDNINALFEKTKLSPTDNDVIAQKDFCDLEAEIVVLSGAYVRLVDNCAYEVSSVTPEMFTDPLNRTLFIEIKRRINDGDKQTRGLDLVPYILEFCENEKEAQLFFAYLITKFVGILTHQGYIYKLQDLLEKRKMNDAIHGFLPNLKDKSLSHLDFQKKTEEFQRQIRTCGFAQFEKNDFTFEEATRKLIEDYESQDDIAIYSSIDGLNKILGGFIASNLYIVGGATGMGKSAFAVQIAKDAGDAGHHSLIFSIEMSNRQLISRIVSNDLLNKHDICVPYEDIVKKRVAKHLYPNVRDLTLNMNQPIKINYSTRMSVESVQAEAIKHDYDLRRNGKKLSMIIVDYLGLLDFSGDNSKEYRNKFTNAIVALKNLAKEMNVVMVVLVQLNRDNTRRTEQAPLLSDIAESSTLANTADAVLLSYRPSYYDDKKYLKTYMEIKIAKQRDGAVGLIRCHANMGCNVITEDFNEYEKGREGWTFEAIQEEDTKKQNKKFKKILD